MAAHATELPTGQRFAWARWDCTARCFRRWVGEQIKRAEQGMVVQKWCTINGEEAGLPDETAAVEPRMSGGNGESEGDGHATNHGSGGPGCERSKQVG